MRAVRPGSGATEDAMRLQAVVAAQLGLALRAGGEDDARRRASDLEEALEFAQAISELVQANARQGR